MARKVMIDCDPGLDDAVALTLALFDPRLEVIAVSAVAGTVGADQTSRNTQSIIERLDPPRMPRLGVARDIDSPPDVDGRRLHGADGLGNSRLLSSQHHRQFYSEKMLCEETLGSPDSVTLITLGPLTNVARAMRREAAFATKISRLIIVGGAAKVSGDVTPAAEFNMYYDPSAAHRVFTSATTKTLIPLDVTQQVSFGLDLLDALPDESTRAGGLLRQVLPFAYRAFHQELGAEMITLNAAVGIVAALQPELFETREMAGDVETRGRIASGATVFDLRPRRTWRNNMEVAIDLDVAAVRDCILRGLRQAGDCTR